MVSCLISIRIVFLLYQISEIGVITQEPGLLIPGCRMLQICLVMCGNFNSFIRLLCINS